MNKNSARISFGIETIYTHKDERRRKEYKDRKRTLSIESIENN